MDVNPNKALIDVLLKEYENLSTVFNLYGSAGFAVTPLLLTASTALLLRASSSADPVGLILAYVMVFLLEFVGVCHSVINSIGIHLVQLELQINRELGVDTRHGLSRYTFEIGEGMIVIPGYKDHSLLIFLIMIALFVVSLIRGFYFIIQTNWHPLKSVLVLGLPIVFGTLSLLIMRRVEKETVRKKKEMISNCQINNG